MLFEKGQYIIMDERKFEVVLADEKLAALVPVKKFKDGRISAKFDKAEIYDNTEWGKQLIPDFQVITRGMI